MPFIVCIAVAVFPACGRRCTGRHRPPMGARHRFVSNSVNPLPHSLMQVKPTKFAALLFASAAALALSSALPVQSFPQWVTIKGEEEGAALIYDYNSLKALPNGIKQIDTYMPRIKSGDVTYISCPRWRFWGEAEWDIIPPDSMVEILAYKLCGKSWALLSPASKSWVLSVLSATGSFAAR